MAIGQVSIVRDGEAAGFQLGEKRLHIAQDGFAGSGVANMADREVALRAPHHALGGEVLPDMTKPAMSVELPSVEADDPGRLLPTVLQSVEPERGMRGSIRMAEDAEHAALILRMVVVISRHSRHAFRHLHHWLPWVRRCKSLRSWSL